MDLTGNLTQMSCMFIENGIGRRKIARLRQAAIAIDQVFAIHSMHILYVFIICIICIIFYAYYAFTAYLFHSHSLHFMLNIFASHHVPLITCISLYADHAYNLMPFISCTLFYVLHYINILLFILFYFELLNCWRNSLENDQPPNPPSQLKASMHILYSANISLFCIIH